MVSTIVSIYVWVMSPGSSPGLNLSDYLSVITSLAIHNLWPFWCVSGFHWNFALVTVAVVEFSGISKFHSVEITLVRMLSGDGEIVLSIEIKF